MSLDQEQTDEDLKAVFDMVDDDNSGHLDKDEVALVIEFFSCACLRALEAACSTCSPPPPIIIDRPFDGCQSHFEPTADTKTLCR